MMENGVLLLKRRWRMLITTSVLVLLAASLVVFFSNNVIAIISVSNVPEGSDLKLEVTKDDEIKSVPGVNIAIIPRGSENLIVSAGSSAKTLSSLSLPWYGFIVKVIDLKPSKDATKVAFASLAGICATYNSELDKLLRYDCASPQTLYEYQTPEDGIWGDRGVRDLSYIENQVLPPYMNGVIGISKTSAIRDNTNEENYHDTPVEIKSTSGDSTKTYPVPSGVTGEGLTGLRIYTDTANTTNSRFILTDGFGTIYLAEPSEQSSETKYKIVSAPDNYSYLYNTTACSLYDGKAVCYRGRNNVPLSNEATTLAQAKIEEYSFTDGLISSKDVESELDFSNIYLTEDGVYGISGKTLYELTALNDKYTLQPIAKNITSATSDGKSILFAYNKAAYTYDPVADSSYQLFQSPNIDVIGLYPVNGKVFIFGTAKQGDTAIYAYRITGESVTTNQRLIDTLPLAYDEIEGLFANDFVGDKIFLQPRIDAAQTDDDIMNNFINTVSNLGVELNSENVQIRR